MTVRLLVKGRAWLASRRIALVKADCYRALQKCINNIMVINAPPGLYLQFVHLRDQQVPRKLFLGGEWFYCVTFTIALRRHGDSRATVLYNYLYPTGGWRFIEERNAPGSGDHRDTNRDTKRWNADATVPGQLILHLETNPVPSIALTHALIHFLLLLKWKGLTSKNGFTGIKRRICILVARKSNSEWFVHMYIGSQV